MRVSDLALNDYRSYRELVASFTPGVTILQGANGRGKTNLVEAIAYLSTFASHRINAESALVRHAQEGDDQPGAAVIRAKLATVDRDFLLEVEIVKGSPNRARLNRAKMSPRELLGILRAVVFAPEDLQLLRGEPALRRRFADQVITEMYPLYAGIRFDFEKVLRQRAATLKQLRSHRWDRGAAEAVLEVWNERLAHLSAQMALLRMVVCRQLGEYLTTAYGQVSNADRCCTLAYHATPENLAETLTSAAAELSFAEGSLDGNLSQATELVEVAYLEEFARRQGDEIERGQNLVGAHRDDLWFKLDDLPVKGYASHGETWSVALAARLAQAELLTYRGDTPIMILDDVFAELDQQRRQALADQLKNFEQVLITAAVPEDVPGSLSAKRLTVTKSEAGISEVSEADA